MSVNQIEEFFGCSLNIILVLRTIYAEVDFNVKACNSSGFNIKDTVSHYSKKKPYIQHLNQFLLFIILAETDNN